MLFSRDSVYEALLEPIRVNMLRYFCMIHSRLRPLLLVVALLASYFSIIRSPNGVQAATFSISDESPFLGDEITIQGSDLLPDQEYLIFAPEAGPEMDYTTTTYQERTAKQFTSTSAFGHTAYYSAAYDEFDKILFYTSYFALSSATNPFFRINVPDIFWDNFGGSVQTVDVTSPLDDSWTDYYYVFDKDKGMQSFEFNLVQLNGNTIYLDKMWKAPAWSITTDSTGSFSTTIHAPRRTSLNNDLSFSYKLFNLSDNSITDAGTIVLDPKYDDFRSVRDMITFHYQHVLPEAVSSPNSAMVFSNQAVRTNPFSMAADWEVGFLGELYRQLGREDLAQTQAYRECRATDNTGRLYPAGNQTDVAINGYRSIRPLYEQNGDATLLTCMTYLKNYIESIYNSTYDVYPHFAGSSEFWIDAIGVGKPQFLYYMGSTLGDETLKLRADGMVNYAIDTLQDPDGWFNWKFNFVTSQISAGFWDGGQPWALKGLREYEDITTDEALREKIHTSLIRLADNLSLRPIEDLRSDHRRSSLIAYELRQLAEDSTYPADKRATWGARAEELFRLALLDKNAEYGDLNKYGLTYYGTNNYTFSFIDLFILKYLDEFYPDSHFFQNRTDGTYNVSKPIDNAAVFLAETYSGGSWSTSTDHPTQVSASGTILSGQVAQGDLVRFTKRDMTATASAGTVDITLESWSSNFRKWRMTSSSNTDVALDIGSLEPISTYYVLRDGLLWKEVISNVSGRVSFLYDGGFSSHIFELTNQLPTTITTASEEEGSVASASTCSSMPPGLKTPTIYAAIPESNSSITLYFTDADGPLDHYALLYGDRTGEYRFGAENIGGINTRKYTVGHLQPNTTYYFKVRAGNGCATGEWSNELSAKTYSDFSTAKGGLSAEIIEAGVRQRAATEVEEDEQRDEESSGATGKEERVLGVSVKIKVVDQNKKPVPGANVTLYSTPRETVTNEDGIALFEGVEPGAHRAVIAFNGQSGEQKINIPENGEVEEVDFTIQIRETSPFTNPWVVRVIAALSLALMGAVVLIFKRRTA